MQFGLTQAWNLSTVYNTNNFSYGAYESDGEGITFKPDGTIMYLTGKYNNPDMIYQYTLTDPWNISSAVNTQNFSLTTQQPKGIVLKPDGTKMYINSDFLDQLVQYTLTEPWNVSTAVNTNNFTLNISGVLGQRETQMKDIFIKHDGTTLYAAGNDNDTLFEFGMTEPWNVSTLYNKANLTVVEFPTSTSPRVITFNTEGTKLYWSGFVMYTYNLLAEEGNSEWEFSTYKKGALNLSLTQPELNPLSFNDTSVWFNNISQVYLDEIRIYNVSLSDSEISSIYNNGRKQNVSILATANDNNLLAYFGINENNGTILHDLSNNSNNATSSGVKWKNNTIRDTLIEDVDYSLSGDAFTILNKNYAWTELIVSYLYGESETNNPNVTSLTEYPTEPALSTGNYFEFNATVTDDTGIDSVIFQFDGTNYTASNTTSDVYNVTFTSLTAGNYNYYWFANDTLGNFNNSEGGTYEVIDDLEFPIFTFESLSTANNTEYNALDYQFNITISSTNETAGIEFNEVNYSLSGANGNEFNSTIFEGLSSGTYPYYYWAYGNGSATNYNTTGIKSYVIQANSSYVLGLGLTPSNTETYGTETTATGSGCPSQITCNLFRDGVGVSNPETDTFRAGSFVYIFNTTGNTNYSSDSVTDTLTINKATPSLSISGTTPITYGTTTDVAGSGCPAQLSCSLDKANQVYGVGESPVAFNYSTEGNQNYSADSDTISITINQYSTSLTLSLSPSNSETYGTETTASVSGCPAQISALCKLFRDGSEVSAPETETLAAGSYDYVYNTTGNENYSSDSDSETLTIGKATGLVYAYVNGSRANFAATNGSGNYNIDLNGTIQTGTGYVGLYLNGSLINNGTGSIQNTTNLTLGTYTLVSSYFGNQNYSSDTETWIVTISLPITTTTSLTDGGACANSIGSIQSVLALIGLLILVIVVGVMLTILMAMGKIEAPLALFGIIICGATFIFLVVMIFALSVICGSLF